MQGFVEAYVARRNAGCSARDVRNRVSGPAAWREITWSYGTLAVAGFIALKMSGSFGLGLWAVLLRWLWLGALFVYVERFTRGGPPDERQLAVSRVSNLQRVDDTQLRVWIRTANVGRADLSKPAN